MAKTGLFSCSDLVLLLRASFLGIPLALLRAKTTVFFSLISGSEQILTILKPSDFGMALVVVFGWQLSGSKYRFPSDGFLYKYVEVCIYWVK